MTPARHVEFLVEEPSMEAFLQVLLPRVLGEVTFKVHAFQCKQDMLDRLPGRLRGYSRWLPSDWTVFALIDRDSDDCRALKGLIEDAAAKAGLVTLTQAHAGSAGSRPWRVASRVVIEELEAWHFGDWRAVKAAYPRVSEGLPRKKGFRDPDAVRGGTWEAFERQLKAAGYFETGLRKIEAARAVAEHVAPARNTSHSFRVFVGALEEAVASGAGPEA